jgi:hypothetical protein
MHLLGNFTAFGTFAAKWGCLPAPGYCEAACLKSAPAL